MKENRFVLFDPVTGEMFPYGVRSKTFSKRKFAERDLKSRFKDDESSIEYMKRVIENHSGNDLEKWEKELKRREDVLKEHQRLEIKEVEISYKIVG